MNSLSVSPLVFSWPLLFAGIAALMLLASCVCDLRRFEIPDTISIVLLITAVLFGLVTPGFGWLSHGGAVLLMFGIGLGLFALGWMGGGDIKLMVAFAGWTGLSGLIPFLLGTMIAGGGLAAILLVARSGFRLAGFESERMPGPLQPGAPLPYALAITAGAAWWASKTLV
ncbi:pilus assembly protein CpaA [Sandaracinobacter neustonicus]|uniref:Pilus assembly protein CpaA n=1 Tax=Sandaracinobacter neustonicus TaxID=1715348 RepID=A0A501XN00_9SPHN|nr:pilus assembly protein CpaA [Sandaracinobacter neustonicus]